MKKLDKKRLIEPILENLRKTGDIKHCAEGIEDISQKTVSRGTDPDSFYFHPEFNRKVNEALKVYRESNQEPHENPQTRKTVLEQFDAMVTSGDSAVTGFEYHEDEKHEKLMGKLRRKTYQRPGLRQWVYEKAFPPPVYAEKAVLDITGNQLSDLMKDDYITEEERKICLQWLTRWIQQAKVELQRQGVSTRLLDGIDKA